MERVPEPFRCDVIPERQAVRVVVHGELDIATAPAFAATLVELHDAGFREIILDLRDLEFLDSTGLRAILDTNHRALHGGAALVVIPGPAPVQRLFDVAGVADAPTFRAR